MTFETADRTEVSDWHEVAAVDADERRCRREKQMAEIRRCKREVMAAEIRRYESEVRRLKECLETSCAGLKTSSDTSASNQLEGISSLVDDVSSNDRNLQLKATIQFCELLSSERNPPINEVMESGVVPRFVEFLTRKDFPQLQCEAAWALANICSGTPKRTRVGISKRDLPIFVKLLGSPNADVREQVVFALGILAGRSPTCRDLVLGYYALVPLLELLKEDSTLSMLRNATWTLSNFCGGMPQPCFVLVRPALETLKRLLHNDDWEVLSDSCLALSYLSNGRYDEIEELIKAGVCPRLVELLSHPSSAVVISALQAIGNFIVSGNEAQIQVILNHGALEYLLRLLNGSHDDKSIKNDACYIISNITATNKDRIQAVIDAQMVEPLVQLLQDAEFDIRACAARALSFVATYGSRTQVKSLLTVSCIKGLFDLVLSPDMPYLFTVLEGLFNIMTKGGLSFKDSLIKDAEMDIKKLEPLSGHRRGDVAEMASLLETLPVKRRRERSAVV